MQFQSVYSISIPYLQIVALSLFWQFPRKLAEFGGGIFLIMQTNHFNMEISMFYDFEQHLLTKIHPSYCIYDLIWNIRWSFLGKKWEICWNSLKSSQSPYHHLINTNCCTKSIFLIDYYIKSLVIGYWNLSRLFSHQVALNSIVSDWLRNLPPSYHSGQIHSLNDTSNLLEYDGIDH